ncbi:hypothetical protein [Dysgonomonas termitidis]|uniref:DUF4221 domain-containing protein n=1 Tax=Dysgonomonas termitidis TaxID=1516126 RepID=A0ABV9KZB4_9BACT
MNRYIYCFLVLFLLSCTKEDDLNIINVSNISDQVGIVVSDTTKEKLAHCSLLYSDRFLNDGTFWISYYCDETQSIENPLHTTIYPVLCRLNIRKKYKDSLLRWPIIKANSIFKDIRIGNRALYDPNLRVNETNIQVYFQALINGKTSIVYREFDKNKLQFKEELQISKLRYNNVDGKEQVYNLDDDGVAQCLKDFGYQGKGITHLIITRFIEYKGYTYMALTPYSGTSRGILLKSSDGIVWDVVTIQPKDILDIESQIEIVDDVIYYVARSAYNKCFIGKYEMLYNRWTDLIEIPKSIGSRPEIFFYKNHLYTVYNISNPVNFGWGVVPRNSATISEVNLSSLDLVTKFTIQNEYGFHYFSVSQFDNGLYMTYSEDRRKLNLHASDIVFLKLDL